jgi:hypothetical protein
MDKLEEIKALVEEWNNKKGHDRCWYYPELFEKIAKIVGVELKQSPELPTLDEFRAGCEKYQVEQFNLQRDISVVK